MVRAHLAVSDALGARTVPLDKERFEIGRRSSHDLYLTGADVSRDHAEIEQKDGRYILRDRGSRLGTFVNGEPVVERTLEHGDRIHIGRNNGSDLVFLLDRAPEPPAAVTTAGADLHQIAALLEGLRALGSGRVLDEVLALVVDSAITVTGAERGFIMLADEAGALEFTMGRGRNRRTLPGHTFQTSRKIPEEVFVTGEARVVTDLLDADLASGHMGTIALGIRHVLCVPLNLVRYVDRESAHIKPRRIGVLYLDGQDEGRLLSASTRNALETLAVEAALAIENARLYRESIEKARLDQQMKIGADIQQALLPPLTFTGRTFEVACASAPCLAIGGDFLDYFELPNGRFGFVLGDVSGKGLPAALLSAMLQGIFATEAPLGRSPAEAVARANRALIRKAVQARYATVFHAVMSEDGRLTYTNAGQNPPIHLSASAIERLSLGGTIVGAFEDATYGEGTVPLAPRDLIVVCSDGVTEAFNAEWEEFGDDRLIDCVRSNAALSPQAIVEAVMTAVRVFAGPAVQSDDQSVIVLRYTGGSDGSEAQPPTGGRAPRTG